MPYNSNRYTKTNLDINDDLTALIEVGRVMTSLHLAGGSL